MDNLRLSSADRLPNALSLFRIPAGLIIIILYDPGNVAAFSVAISFALLGEVSDHLDGVLARRRGVASEVGYVLDGLGDRALHSALILVLFPRHDLNRLAVWLLIFGQILICGLRLIQGTWHSRVATVRALHILHWTCLRLWILTYLIQDAELAWGINSIHLITSNLLFFTAQISLAWIASGTLYYAVYLKTSEILRREAE